MVSANTTQATTGKETETTPLKLGVRDLNISYGGTPALSDVTLDVREHEIFGIIGPANAGKTSFLKVLNRMNTFDSNMEVKGTVLFNGLAQEIRYVGPVQQDHACSRG